MKTCYKPEKAGLSTFHFLNWLENRDHEEHVYSCHTEIATVDLKNDSLIKM